MTGADWLKVLGGGVLLTVVLTLLRWQAAEIVFWVLKTHAHRWADVAKGSGAFAGLYAGADMATHLGQENERLQGEVVRLHEMVENKLQPLMTLGPQFTALNTSVQLLTEQTARLSIAVEKIPDLSTAVEVLKAAQQNRRRGT